MDDFGGSVHDVIRTRWDSLIPTQLLSGGQSSPIAAIQTDPRQLAPNQGKI